MSEKIDDGFSTTVDIFDDPEDVTPLATLRIWEKTVTPPGVQGGGPNDTTTMRNTRWRTRAPKKLLTLSTMSVTAAYDPEVYETILSIIQINKWLVVNFADGSRLGFWGWLDEFTPNEVSEGEQPDADVTFEPSNQDADGEEAEPVYYGAGS